MQIFKKLGTIIKSNFNDLLDRAEDPEKMIVQALREMTESLREAKVQVSRAIRDKKILEQKYQEHKEQRELWEKRAVLALEDNNESLAREALTRKKSCESLEKSLQKQYEDQMKFVEKLKVDLDALEAKIEDAKRKKDVLLARQKRAVAQHKIQSSLAGLSKDSIFETFDRMEDKIESMEAQASATEEIAELEGDTLDSQFEKLESNDVEDELAMLKAKLGKG